MTDSYLRVCPINENPIDFPSPHTLSYEYPYPLDPFQKHAISAIHRGENVFVTAKTGSGKTLVGEYQIHHSLARGGRVFYTTPIKSLSNQKFNDLSRIFPSVGIMTGDIKFRPDAQVIVMTTEILRNLLYKRGTATEKFGLTADLSLDGLDAVVFDEVHYINNHERGKVWEETLILLPPEIHLILLSATLAQPEIFGGWLGRLKEVTVNLISTQYRVVPLTHSMVFWEGEVPQLKTIMDSKEIYNDKVYIDWLKNRKTATKDAEKFKEAVAAKNSLDKANALNEEYEKSAVAANKPRNASHIWRVNRLVEYMKKESLLPCLMFIFSRKRCEEYAQKIDVELLDWCESSEVASMVKNYLATRPEIKSMTQTQELEKLLLKGVAYHHSGLLPVLKEIVEILFGRGLIKVMFCTETFAVGINMPTKSAVFLGYKKYSDEQDALRVLYTDEYMQMAGRAGRRGLDKVGHVLHLPAGEDRDMITAEQMKKMIKSAMPSVQSRMDFSYEFILKTINVGGDLWQRVIQNSYWADQQRSYAKQLLAERKAIEKKMAALEIDKLLPQLREGWALQENMNESKPARQAFDRWRQVKIGPVWDSAWKKMKEFVAAEKQIAGNEAEAREIERLLENPAELLEKRMRVLQELGFVSMNTDALENKLMGLLECGVASVNTSVDITPILTKEGLMASEINEGSALLMAEFYLSGVLRGKPWNVVAAALCGFIGDEFKAQSSIYYNTIDMIVKGIRKKEDDCGVISKDSEWVYDGKWVSMFEDYLGVIDDPLPIDILCRNYEIYEGDFMKALTKCENLVNEWKTLCEIDENVRDLEEMAKFSRLTETDSIYLREAVKEQHKLAKQASD
jgi:replicative superfamily II helicase